MTESRVERSRLFLSPRITPIHDELLEEYVVQITSVISPVVPLPNYDSPELGWVERWVNRGHSAIVAAAIAKYEIPDILAKKLLATALENNALYFEQQPMYYRMKKVLDKEILWMRNAAKRLRNLEI